MGCSDVELGINLCHHVAGILNLRLPRSDIYAEIWKKLMWKLFANGALWLVIFHTHYKLYDEHVWQNPSLCFKHLQGECVFVAIRHTLKNKRFAVNLKKNCQHCDGCGRSICDTDLCRFLLCKRSWKSCCYTLGNGRKNTKQTSSHLSPITLDMHNKANASTNSVDLY